MDPRTIDNLKIADPPVCRKEKTDRLIERNRQTRHLQTIDNPAGAGRNNTIRNFSEKKNYGGATGTSHSKH